MIPRQRKRLHMGVFSFLVEAGGKLDKYFINFLTLLRERSCFRMWRSGMHDSVCAAVSRAFLTTHTHPNTRACTHAHTHTPRHTHTNTHPTRWHGFSGIPLPGMCTSRSFWGSNALISPVIPLLFLTHPLQGAPTSATLLQMQSGRSNMAPEHGLLLPRHVF